MQHCGGFVVKINKFNNELRGLKLEGLRPFFISEQFVFLTVYKKYT